MKDFALINGMIVTANDVFAGTVFVRNGKIKDVKKGVLSAAARVKLAKSGKNKITLIDLKGRHILPGLIDAHVHFRTPGMTQKEDWTSGSKAALAGGVTTVLDMPNTVPATTSLKLLREKRALVAKKALVNYGFYLGATLDNLKELSKVKNIAGVKIYMGSSTGSLLVKDKEILEKFFAEAAGGRMTSGSDGTAAMAARGGKSATVAGKSGRILLAIHAESEDCIRAGMEKFADKIGSGETVSKTGEPVSKSGAHGNKFQNAVVNDISAISRGAEVHSLIRAPECAYRAVKEVMHLAKKYGTKVHICHLSTEQELNVLKKFKIPAVKSAKKSLVNASMQISAEVTPHHLFITEKGYPMYGNLIKVNPPVRGIIDQVALWDGINKGLIDMVATDHAPHLYEEKMKPYAQAPSGIPGVQTMLPLLLTAVNEGKLSLSKLVELTSFNPARRFGIMNKGEIKKGFDADLTVVDLNLKESVNRNFFWSKANWSPYHGLILKGWPVMTFVNGELMYEWRDKDSSGNNLPYLKTVYNPPGFVAPKFGKKLGREVRFE